MVTPRESLDRLSGMAARARPSVDVTPTLAQPLRYSELRETLKDILDFERFKPVFINQEGPYGNLLRPLTLEGEVQALGSVPVTTIQRGNQIAVQVGRFPDRRIMMRLDTRLLRNPEALKQVVRHEVAEINKILGFENRPMEPSRLYQLLAIADEFGYRAE